MMAALKTNILIVEDDPNIRKTVADFLQKSQFIVETASNGLIGLKKLMTKASNTILMTDYEMPVINGAQLIELVIRTKINCVVGIITASGSSFEEETLQNAMRSIKASGLPYKQITKPYGQKEVSLAVQDILTSWKEMPQKKERPFIQPQAIVNAFRELNIPSDALSSEENE